MSHRPRQAAKMENLRFLEHPKFPSDSLANHIRIVDTNSINDQADLNSASALDAAMTLLYNYEPAVLDKFFDPAHLGVQFARKPTENMDGVIVERSKISIWVGHGHGEVTWVLSVQYKADDQGSRWEIDGVLEGNEYASESTYDDSSARLARWIYDNKAWENAKGDEVTFTLDEELAFRRVYITAEQFVLKRKDGTYR